MGVIEGSIRKEESLTFLRFEESEKTVQTMSKLFFLAIILPLASAFWSNDCQTTPNNPSCNADTEILCPGGADFYGCYNAGHCVPKFDSGRKDNSGNPCPGMCPPPCNQATGDLPCPPTKDGNGCLVSPICVKNWFHCDWSMVTDFTG